MLHAVYGVQGAQRGASAIPGGVGLIKTTYAVPEGSITTSNLHMKTKLLRTTSTDPGSSGVYDTIHILPHRPRFIRVLRLGEDRLIAGKVL